MAKQRSGKGYRAGGMPTLPPQAAPRAGAAMAGAGRPAMAGAGRPAMTGGVASLPPQAAGRAGAARGFKTGGKIDGCAKRGRTKGRMR